MQTNYNATKAGVTSSANIASLELDNFWATVNAVAPVVVTHMTEHLGLVFETKAECD